MFKTILYLTIILGFISCSSLSRKKELIVNDDILNRAEVSATPLARKILETSRSMVASQEVLVGGCWDYINEVYIRSGIREKERMTILKSNKDGPYTTIDQIKPGDWLYFVNHSYKENEHSALFVAWSDQSKKMAITVSYQGEKKKVPATYKQFVLDKVYNIVRAKEDN